MHKVAVDIENAGAVPQFINHMGIPNLVEQGPRHLIQLSRVTKGQKGVTLLAPGETLMRIRA
jgi:hypothetical protein